MSDKNVANRLTGSALIKSTKDQKDIYQKANKAALTVGDVFDALKKAPRSYSAVVYSEGSADVYSVEVDHAQKSVEIVG